MAHDPDDLHLIEGVCNAFLFYAFVGLILYVIFKVVL